MYILYGMRKKSNIDMRFNCTAVVAGIDYLLQLPEKYRSDHCYPLLLRLHGAGLRGGSLLDVRRNRITRLIQSSAKPEMIIESPLCMSDSWYSVLNVLSLLTEALIGREDVDSSRVYLTGNSMGGYGCWALAMMHPEWFAAIVPVCGGGMCWNAAQLKDVPIWAFHGKLDTVVLPSESQHMVEAVLKAGGNARLTLYEDTEHDSWTAAYSNPDVYTWLFRNKKC